MKPNTAPIITLIAAMPTVPDKSHLDGIIMNIYGIPIGMADRIKKKTEDIA